MSSMILAMIPVACVALGVFVLYMANRDERRRHAIYHATRLEPQSSSDSGAAR
jgi:cytochrome c-type biogenesis protein CcmH/NrfF